MDLKTIISVAVERAAFAPPGANGMPTPETQADVAAILALCGKVKPQKAQGVSPAPAAPKPMAPSPAAYRHDALAVYESHHAPAGGLNVAGKQYVGGEFVPAEEVAKASPAERAQLSVKRSLPEKIRHAPKAIAGALTPEAIGKAAETILHGVTHPVATAQKAASAAKAKLASIYDKYGAVGVAAVASAYVAYYATAIANPVMFTIPVPLTPTILTCAELVRKGVAKAKGVHP